MKLIQQASLWFSEGASDKVYEVDLCDVGNDRFVVNFRYGRRGASLRDGTKTTLPVSQAEALKIFDKLVSGKKKEGYQESGTFQIEPPALDVVTPETETAAPANTPLSLVLKQLIEATQPASANKKIRPLNRLIWRVGEFRLASAVPVLIRQVAKADALQQYCIVWALGRCGDKAAIPVLEKLYAAKASAPMVQRMALASMLALAEGYTRKSLLETLLGSLPNSIAQAMKSGTAQSLLVAVQAYVASEKNYDIVEPLYVLSPDFPVARPVVIELAQTVPFAPNAFKSVRHVFKLAEFRDDAELFGLLAYRFETTRHVFNQKRYSWDDHIYFNGRRINPQKELEKPDSQLAYSNKTRDYLRRRTWRTLRRLGEQNSPLYAPMAVHVLLPFSDAKDATPARMIRRETYDWRNRNTIVTVKQYDSYANYQVFNHILYENSPRYLLKKNRQAWQCKEGYEPGKPAPVVREEAFPELWNTHPDALIQLLTGSQCERVHEFAVKAFRANPDFTKRITVQQLIQLLEKPYAVTIRLALELVQANYDPQHPNVKLVRAVLQSNLPEARAIGKQWVEANPDYFAEKTLLFADLIGSPHEDVQTWCHALLGNTKLTSQQAELTIASVIAQLLSLENQPVHADMVNRATDTLLAHFSGYLQIIGLSVVQDLLRHPLPEIKALGGKILLIHQTPVRELPSEILSQLIGSEYPQVRHVGVQLFGKQTDAELLARPEALLAFCVAPHADMREAIRPVITRLAAQHPAFGTELLTQLFPYLRRNEAHDGLHESIFNLMQTSLVQSLSGVDQETSLELVFSRRAAVQKVGSLLLHQTIRPDILSLRQLVRLAGHEMQEVRQWAWQAYQTDAEQIKLQPAEALRILDVNWEDSRRFAFDYFRTHFNADVWTPELLVSVCDSTRDDVQQFGRELITQYFTAENGTDYLLKLSQHPSSGLQLFATHYLETYAAGNITHLRTLEPYFLTVLSQVNRAGVAKKRIFAFLRNEALANRDAAELIAQILTRQSLTMAVADKATCLQLMRDIRVTYPDISQPLTITAAPVYATESS